MRSVKLPINFLEEGNDYKGFANFMSDNKALHSHIDIGTDEDPFSDHQEIERIDFQIPFKNTGNDEIFEDSICFSLDRKDAIFMAESILSLLK